MDKDPMGVDPPETENNPSPAAEEKPTIRKYRGDTGTSIATLVKELYTHTSSSGSDFSNIVHPTVQERSDTYHPVTKAEIETYAQLSWFATIILTFFGVFAGFAGGTGTAVIQTPKAADYRDLLIGLTIFSIVIAIVLLGLAIWSIFIQQKTRAWDKLSDKPKK